MLRLAASRPGVRLFSSLVETSTVFHNTKLVLAEFREERNSLIKEIFRGEPSKILSFPDVLPTDPYLNLQKDLQDKESFPSIQNRCVTEIANIWENVSKPENLSHWESLYGALHYLKEPLETHGNSNLRTKYFSSLLEGKLRVGFCLHDIGASLNSSEANVAVDLKGDNIILEGSKKNVLLPSSGHADVYLIHAHTKDNLISLVVPSDTPGISVVPCEEGIIGYPRDSLADLRLSNVSLSKDCILCQKSEDVMETGSFMPDMKLYRAARILAVLRGLLDEAIRHAHESFLSDSPLCDSSLVRSKVSNCAAKIYALESMLYMTAGLADVQARPDYKLDAVSVKLYADEVAGYVVKEVFDILGSRSIREVEMFHGASRQLLASTLSGNDNHFLQIYLGSMAIEDLLETPKIPMGLLNDAKFILNVKQIKSKKNWKLYPYLNLKHRVHPSLEPYADIVENAILYLNAAIVNILKNKEDKQVEDEEVLLRIGGGGVLVHGMLCSLIRASHAYCAGLRHGDFEKILAQTFIHEANVELRGLLKDETNVPPRPYVRMICEGLNEGQGYVSSHPLDHNKIL